MVRVTVKVSVKNSFKIMLRMLTNTGKNPTVMLVNDRARINDPTNLGEGNYSMVICQGSW